MSSAINGRPTPLQERVAQLCDPYQGEEGANAVRMLADEVGRVERETNEAGPACDQLESAKKTLAMMRHEYNALDRWLSAYRALVAQNERAKDDLEEAIKRLEKEVEG